MPTSVVKIPNFSGGVNRVAVDESLAPNEFRTLKNFQYRDGELGAIETRLGQTRYNSTGIASKPIQGLVRYYSSDGKRQLIAYCDGRLWKGDDAAGTFSQIGSGLSPDTSLYMDFEVLDGILYLGNGFDQTRKWTGATFDTVGSASDPKFDQFAQAHSVDAGILYGVAPADPFQIRYSDDVNGPEIWPADNLLTVRQFPGDTRIVTIEGQGSNIVAYKENSISIKYGAVPSEFRMLDVVQGLGCVAPRSLVNVAGLHFFLWRDGFYSFNGAGQPTKVSGKIDPVIQDTDPALLPRSVAFHHPKRRQIWLVLPDESAETGFVETVWVLDLRLGAWLGPYPGHPVNVAAVWQGSADKSEITTGSPKSDGFVTFWDRGATDLGSAIPVEWDKGYIVPFQDRDAQFRRFHVDVVPVGNWSGDVKYAADYSTSFQSSSISFAGDSLWGTFVWGTDAWDGTTRKHRVVALKRAGSFGKSIRVKFEKSDASQPVGFYNFSVDFTGYNRR